MEAGERQVGVGACSSCSCVARSRAVMCGWMSGSLTAAGAAPATPAAPDACRPRRAPQVTKPTASDGNDTVVRQQERRERSRSTSAAGPTANGNKKPGQSVVIILLADVLAIAPALLVMMTGFTRIVIVLSLTRNALGLPSIPPNQVVVGLSLFLSLFVMAPTLSKINEVALQPLLDGKIDYSQAYQPGQVPLRTFMLEQTRRGELNMFINASGSKKPPRPARHPARRR